MRRLDGAAGTIVKGVMEQEDSLYPYSYNRESAAYLAKGVGAETPSEQPAKVLRAEVDLNRSRRVQWESEIPGRADSIAGCARIRLSSFD
jgi:hypothetical protein